MLTIRAMSDGKGYSARHLEHNDYYAEGERVVGEWFGRGGELLGLNGAVVEEDFEAVRRGLDPKTKDFLRVRQSSDRVAADGTKLAQGRSLYDFTISAPKSVSVVAILGEDRHLVDAHQRAVREALRELETYASARIRQGGANADRVTGNMVIAVYHHDSSRELDPQLHTHAVAANLTFDGVEGRWKALQASDIYECRAYLTEVYRNALAREIRALGYDIDNRLDSKGRDCGFEIRGVPGELLTRFSQRSHQRDRAIEDFVAQNSRQPTDNEVAVLVRESRADKLIEISTGELREKQRARLSVDDDRVLAEVRNNRMLTEVAIEQSEASLDYAKAHVFERVSVAEDHEVLMEALRHGRGRIHLDRLKGELALQESVGRILRSGREIATMESLDRERSMIASIDRRLGGFEPLGRGQSCGTRDSLRAEQRDAIKCVLKSRDRAVSISGAAGTGKTATLQELRRALSEAGREVLAVAPTMSAVEELQKVGFASAVTLERLLQDPQMSAGLSQSVMILDEAGMVSARQMSDFLHMAEKRSLRIIFSGDTKQIQSVEAGDALRILEKESRLKTFALTQVQRQTRREYRDAIQELRRHPERGFAKLNAIGAVREVATMERAQAVANAFAARGERTSLVVCATHDEIDRVTEAIRDARKKTGGLGKAITLKRHVSLGWTMAQKSDFQNFRRGQILEFHRAVKGISKHESAEVLRADTNGVVVRTAAGIERRLTSKQAKSFDVFEAKPFDIATGDRLLLTANRREEGLRITNGELATVTDVDSSGRIQLQDGRTLPANYRSFAHGYAVTAHRSQGKSVDSVIISADGMRKELFYVAASRGRESIMVITSDKERLNQTVARTAARKSASELVQSSRPLLVRGTHRGLAMARELVRRTAEFFTVVPKRLMKQAMSEPRKEQRRERAFGR
jgi:conjugative relaxase-like TrwC/TraI family protein